MKRLFQTISWVFMPILMPIYGLLIVMFTPSEPYNLADGNSLYFYPFINKLTILGFFLMFSVIIPGAIYIVMQKLNYLKTIEMDDKEERKSPMIIMSLCCLFLLYFFNSLSTELPKYIYALCFSGAFIISLFSFINIRFKISLHATGVGIFTGFLMAYFVDQIYFKVYFLALAFILSGLVITARLYLQKHSFKEVILGYFLSLLITFVLNLYYPTATII